MARRRLQCLSCEAQFPVDGRELPAACPRCAAPWRDPGVIFVEVSAEPYGAVLLDGASLLRDDD